MTILNRFGAPYDPHDSLIYPPRIPSRAWLRAASAHLLNANYATQPDEPGMVQPFPATAAACTALGWPSPTALWLCDEGAGNLVDEIGGVALVPGGTPLQNRILQGVASGTSLWSKTAVECRQVVNERFQCATPATLDVGTQDFTLSVFRRTPPVFVGSGGLEIWLEHANAGVNRGWYAYFTATQWGLCLLDATGSTAHLVAQVTKDAGAHLSTISVDRDGNVAFYWDEAATQTVAAQRPGALTQAERGICLGNNNSGTYSSGCQFGWAMLIVGTAATRVGHDAMWKHLLASGLGGTPNTYTRASTMSLPISATQTATAGSGQVGIGYCAAAVDAAGGNALGTGLCFENATTFLAVGTNNMPGWGIAAATLVAVDGVNSMRSGIRVTMTLAWALGSGAYTPAPYATVGAPSNDNYAWGGWVKRGTVGATGRAGYANFTGGVREDLLIWSSDAVPVGWTYVSGTFAMANAGNTRGIFEFGASLAGDNCEFSDWFVVKGTTIIPLAMIYTGTGAAVAMAAPVSLIDNTLGQRFSPAGGEIEIELAGFAGAFSAGVPADLFHAVPAAGDAGRLYWRYLNAGTIEITAYNAAGAVAWQMTTAAVPDTAYHKYRLRWCAANPVYRTGGVSYYACLEEITAANPGGVVIDYAGAAAYAVPLATTVPNLYTGSYAGINAARCSIASLDVKTAVEYKE